MQKALHQRAEADHVVDAVQVQGAAHGGRAEQRLVEDQRRQLVDAKTHEPAPEPDIRVVRLLRLQPAQELDALDDAAIGALEQHLPGQRGAVERAGGKNLRHRRLLL